MNLETYIARIEYYAPYVNMDKIIKAYNFGDKAHTGQKRKSGEKFFYHPVAVSLILAELEMDEDTIIAALLHDTVEDTDAKLDDIKEQFGENVAHLVDGVTKLGVFDFETTKEERQVENLRKMFLAMANDIRVILIKLADRLHNIRTLSSMTPEKQKEKAKETIEIFAPIANRLGISAIKWELEDLSFKYLDPVGYDELIKKVNKKRTERESIINGYIDQLKKEIAKLNIECEIYGRPKNFYSIYKKMKYQHKEFDEIYDLTAIRVVCDSIKDCYTILGVIHTMWKPIPGRFKDYIAMPKANMYQSLHTTVMGNGEPFEIQIRTYDMHRISEYGIAAHWKYKEVQTGNDDGQNPNMEEKLSEIRQIMQQQTDLSDPSEFMKSLKFDLFSTEVFVFSPQGKVVELPVGATPVDFAYKIHSEVGNKCVGAKVDGRIVPLNFQLSNGQRVEILTSKNSNGPSRDWLKFVKSTHAKNRIKQWFKKERREENIEKGREMILSELKKNHIPYKEVLTDNFIEELLDRLSCKTLDDLFAAIGYGGIQTNQVIPKLREKYNKEIKKETPQTQEVEEIKDYIAPVKHNKRNDTGVTVKGAEDLLVKFGKCCSPVQGDEIIGYITRGRGVTVHRADCKNFEKSEDAKNRFIEVEWTKEENSSYTTNIQVVAPDRKGLLSEITLIMMDIDAVVTGINAKTDKNGIAIINLTIEISNIGELNKSIAKLKNLSDIIEVKRVGAL